MAVGAGESGLQGNREASAEAGVKEGPGFWSSLMFWKRGSGGNPDSEPRHGGPTPFAWNAFARSIPNQTRDPGQHWMEKREEASRAVRVTDFGTQMAQSTAGGSLGSALQPGGQFDQILNLPYIAADEQVEIGQAAQEYPVIKRKWARDNMGNELATDKEIRVFIANRVREDDARKAQIAKAEAHAYRLRGAGKGLGQFDVSPVGDLLRNGVKVVEREEDGSFTSRDPGELRQTVKQTGEAPIFFENERVAQARANDSHYENSGQFMRNLGEVASFGGIRPEIQNPYQLPAAKSEVLRERKAATLRNEERKTALASAYTDRTGKFEIRRKQIETTGLTGEQKEVAWRELETEAARQFQANQGSRKDIIEGAFKELNAGYLSVQQFAELLEADGQHHALEAIIAAKENEAIQESAETKLAALKIGSQEALHRGEGSDPRATKRYRELSRMITTPGLMVTNIRMRSSALKPDSRLTDESYREQSINDWQDDGTYVATLATPEERLAYVEALPEMQAMREEIAAFQKKEDALLKQYEFDPATEERIKHRALLQAARDLPRDSAEWAGNVDNWFSKAPVVGGGYAAAIMLPVAMSAYRLEKGEQLSQEELAILDDTLIELERPNTWLANTLSMTVESASIATELYLTAGIGTAVRKGATKVTEEVFANLLRQFATKSGRDAVRKQMSTRALAGAAGVAAQTVTGTGSRVLHRAMVDLGTSGVTVTQDDLGHYEAVLDATQRPGSVWEAAGKAARYQFMENTSEKLGSVFSALGGERVVKQALSKLSKPAKERLSKMALFMAVAKLNPGKKLEGVQRFLAGANIDSIPVEYAEELLAPGLHMVFDGEKYRLPSMEDVASMAFTIAVTGTAMTVANWRDQGGGKMRPESDGTPLGRALRVYNDSEPEAGPPIAGSQGVLPPQYAVLETSLSGNGGASILGEQADTTRPEKSHGETTDSIVRSTDESDQENSRRNAGWSHEAAIDVTRRDQSDVRSQSPAAVVRANSQQRKNQFRRIIDFAKESGGLFESNRLGVELDNGGEHTVHLAVDKPGRVYKVTHPQYSGLTRTTLAAYDGSTRVTEDDALPDEYLERWKLSNRVFGDDVELEGVMDTPGGPSLVISQRLLEGPNPSEAEIVQHLRDELGFEQTGDGHWYRSEDDIAIADTKRANFVKVADKIYAIDAIAFRPSPAMKRVWRLSEGVDGSEIAAGKGKGSDGAQTGGASEALHPGRESDVRSPLPPLVEQANKRSSFIKQVGSSSSLDTDHERHVFERFRERVAQDVPAAVQEYVGRFGNVVDTDLARELEPAYAQSRETRQKFARATSPVASALAREVYDSLLQKAPSGDVLFNAGGPGSGKSRTLAGDNLDSYAIVYDTVMADGKRAVQQIESAIANGHKVVIRYIHQPLDAAIRNTIERAADANNGRIVEAYAAARAHASAQRAIFEVAHHFEGNQSVIVEVIDNTNFKARRIDLSELAKMRYTNTLEELEKRAMNVAKEYFDEHRSRAEFTPELRDRVLRAPSARKAK